MNIKCCLKKLNMYIYIFLNKLNISIYLSVYVCVCVFILKYDNMSTLRS